MVLVRNVVVYLPDYLLDVVQEIHVEAVVAGRLLPLLVQEIRLVQEVSLLRFLLDLVLELLGQLSVLVLIRL